VRLRGGARALRRPPREPRLPRLLLARAELGGILAEEVRAHERVDRVGGAAGADEPDARAGASSSRVTSPSWASWTVPARTGTLSPRVATRSPTRAARQAEAAEELGAHLVAPDVCASPTLTVPARCPAKCVR
jgi:hypothetical protein